MELKRDVGGIECTMVGICVGKADGAGDIVGCEDGLVDGAVQVSTIMFKVNVFELLMCLLSSITSNSTPPSVLSGCFITVTTPLQPLESVLNIPFTPDDVRSNIPTVLVS